MGDHKSQLSEALKPIRRDIESVLIFIAIQRYVKVLGHVTAWRTSDEVGQRATGSINHFSSTDQRHTSRTQPPIFEISTIIIRYLSAVLLYISYVTSLGLGDAR